VYCARSEKRTDRRRQIQYVNQWRIQTVKSFSAPASCADIVQTSSCPCGLSRPLHYYAPAHRAEALSDDARLTSVCLSVAYIGLSREQRPRKSKIGTEVADVTRDSNTTFQIRRSKVNLFDGQKGIAVLCFDSVGTNLVK